MRHARAAGSRRRFFRRCVETSGGRSARLISSFFSRARHHTSLPCTRRKRRRSAMRRSLSATRQAWRRCRTSSPSTQHEGGTRHGDAMSSVIFWRIRKSAGVLGTLLCFLCAGAPFMASRRIFGMRPCVCISAVFFTGRVQFLRRNVHPLFD